MFAQVRLVLRNGASYALIVGKNTTTLGGSQHLIDTPQLLSDLAIANGFKVSETSYFVYVNGKTDRKSFDGKLEFHVAVIPYKGSDKWIEKALKEIKECLMGKEIPKAGPGCEYCSYVDLVENETKTKNTKQKKAKKSVAKGSNSLANNQNLF